jgi:hypothetical protein
MDTLRAEAIRSMGAAELRLGSGCWARLKQMEAGCVADVE